MNPVNNDNISHQKNFLRSGTYINRSKVTGNTTHTPMKTLNGKERNCPACTPQAHASPDIVIPFWEHDLCKVKITAKSLAVHDPGRMFGDVYLMWVSKRPAPEYQGPLDDIKRILLGTHVVKIIDFSR